MEEIYTWIGVLIVLGIVYSGVVGIINQILNK